MGRSTPGIHRGKDGRWHVDKIVRGARLPRGSFASLDEAEGWLTTELVRRRAAAPGAVPTFDQAAAHYVLKHEAKISLELDVYLLKLLVPYIGALPIDQVHDETLKPFIQAMQAGKKPATRPLSAKTINLGLGIVRRILNLAARAWRGEDKKPWLKIAPPLIQFVVDGEEREPLQLTWPGQRVLLPQFPPHLARMALFDLNAGLRDEPLCNLRWKWEVQLPELGFSVFVVPRRWVKGRKHDRVVVCNSVAQSVIESVRGQHPEFVFVYSAIRKEGKKPRYRPIGTMHNTAWQKGRKRAGWETFRVHDMRHTVGMRLREAGVKEETRDDILWHERPGMPAHYSVAQVVEIRAALELITDERHVQNVSLASLIRDQRVPAEVPTPKKAVA